MADKYINIPMIKYQITLFLDYNKWLKHLDTKLDEPKVLNPTNIKPTIKKTLL